MKSDPEIRDLLDALFAALDAYDYDAGAAALDQLDKWRGAPEPELEEVA